MSASHKVKNTISNSLLTPAFPGQCFNVYRAEFLLNSQPHWETRHFREAQAKLCKTLAFKMLLQKIFIVTPTQLEEKMKSLLQQPASVGRARTWDFAWFILSLSSEQLEHVPHANTWNSPGRRFVSNAV